MWSDERVQGWCCPDSAVLSPHSSERVLLSTRLWTSCALAKWSWSARHASQSQIPGQTLSSVLALLRTSLSVPVLDSPHPPPPSPFLPPFTAYSPMLA